MTYEKQRYDIDRAQTLLVCTDCGVVVSDTKLHDRWHAVHDDMITLLGNLSKLSHKHGPQP